MLGSYFTPLELQHLVPLVVADCQYAEQVKGRHIQALRQPWSQGCCCRGCNYRLPSCCSWTWSFNCYLLLCRCFRGRLLKEDTDSMALPLEGIGTVSVDRLLLLLAKNNPLISPLSGFNGLPLGGRSFAHEDEPAAWASLDIPIAEGDARCGGLEQPSTSSCMTLVLICYDKCLGALRKVDNLKYRKIIVKITKNLSSTEMVYYE